MGLRHPDADGIRSGAAASRSRPGTALALGVDAVHAGRDLRVGQLYHLHTHGGTYSPRISLGWTFLVKWCETHESAWQ